MLDYLNDFTDVDWCDRVGQEERDAARLEYTETQGISIGEAEVTTTLLNVEEVITVLKKHIGVGYNSSL